LVSEVGLTPKEVSQLTIPEVNQLKRGQELFNEEKEKSANRTRTPTPHQRRAEEKTLQKYA